VYGGVLVLEFELSISYLPDRPFVAKAMPPSLFTQIILEIESCIFLLRMTWTMILLFYASHQSCDNRHAPLHLAIGWDGVL
jgi:hypothetical protein